MGCCWYRRAAIHDTQAVYFDSEREETIRQRVAAAIIKAQLRIREHRYLNRRRATAYFAAAEDEAWFLLSLSQKPAAEANITASAILARWLDASIIRAS